MGLVKGYETDAFSSNTLPTRRRVRILRALVFSSSTAASLACHFTKTNTQNHINATGLEAKVHVIAEKKKKRCASGTVLVNKHADQS